MLLYYRFLPRHWTTLLDLRLRCRYFLPRIQHGTSSAAFVVCDYSTAPSRILRNLSKKSRVCSWQTFSRLGVIPCKRARALRNSCPGWRLAQYLSRRKLGKTKDTVRDADRRQVERSVGKPHSSRSPSLFPGPFLAYHEISFSCPWNPLACPWFMQVSLISVSAARRLSELKILCRVVHMHSKKQSGEVELCVGLLVLDFISVIMSCE